MKQTLLALTLLLFSACALAQGPNNCVQGANPCQYKVSTSTSATALTIPSNGGLVPTFAYSWTGSPTAVTTVLQGCTFLKCDTLDSYSGATATNRSSDKFSAITPVTIAYNYFIITSTWTGTSTFTVYERNNLNAKLGGGASGGITNSAGNNVVMKSNGTNAVASSITDNATTVSTSESIQAPIQDMGGAVYNAAAYGIVGDERKLTNAAMTASGTTITSTFTAADTGKTATINAGTQQIRVATYVSGGTITGGASGNYCVVTGLADGAGGTGANGLLGFSAPNTPSTFYPNNGGSGYTSTTVTGTLSAHTSTDPLMSEPACSGTATFTVTDFYQEPIVGTLTYLSPTTATLSVSAVTSVTGATLFVGTDNSTAMLSLLSTVYTAGGGTIYLPKGRYLMLSQFLLPNDGAGRPNQPPITLSGAGAGWAGYFGPMLPASALDLRYSSGPKIDTRGTGILRIAALGLEDNGYDTSPFLQTTNTTLFVDHSSCSGSGGAEFGAGALSQQDCFVLGGTTTSFNGTATAAFQGYGTVIDTTFFDKIQRGVYGRVYSNSTVFSNNTFSYSCGGVTAIEYTGVTGESDNNVWYGNLIELGGYTYGATLRSATQNLGTNNTFWDYGPFFISSVTTIGASVGNTCLNCSGVVWIDANHAPFYDQAGTNPYSFSDGSRNFLSNSITAFNPAAANNALTTMITASAGTDATLNPLSFVVAAFPSATGTSRYAAIYAADSGNYRPINFTHSNVSIAGNLAVGKIGPSVALDVAGAVQVAGAVTPTVAGADAIGTAPLPFSDGYFGGAANHSFHFDTSAVASNVAVAVPNHASNTVQGIANPSDSQVVNYIGTDGVQNRIAQSGGISGLTTGYIPQATSATTIGNTSPVLDNGITTANTLTYAGSGGIKAPQFTSAGDGTHAGIWTPVFGTAPSLTANTANLIGPVTAPGTAFAFAMPTAIFTTGHLIDQTVSGAVMTLHDSGVATSTVAVKGKPRACEVVWGGTGTSNVLQSGDDAIANNSCFNKTGSTETITALYCMGDIGSDTVTVTPTFGAAGTGTTICSAPLTCGSSYAYSSTCTVSNASLLDGNGITPAMAGTLNAHSIHMLVVYTVPF
jgi:hypothetical protein